MFFISTTLLLAATCLLVKADLIAERVTSCGSETVHRLSCDSGSVISVETSFYGRTDSETCAKGRTPSAISDTGCSLASAADLVKKRCNGKKVCELNADSLGNSDPCKGTVKYLHTTYTCIPANQGQVIFIHGADYGRRDKATCAYGRPASQLENTACSSPTNAVADSCNGENSCMIKASNSVFGEPCYGTFKYLEVAYTCQYPVLSPDESA